MAEGVVKDFNATKGYGWLDSGDGVDCFVHFSQIVKEGYKTLAPGERVSFEIREGPKGRFAENVVPL